MDLDNLTQDEIEQIEQLADDYPDYLIHVHEQNQTGRKFPEVQDEPMGPSPNLKDEYPDFTDEQLEELLQRKGGNFTESAPLSLPETEPLPPHPPMINGTDENLKTVDLNNLVKDVGPKKAPISNPNPPVPNMVPANTPPPVMDEQAIIAKYGLDKFSPAKRMELVQMIQAKNSPPNWIPALGALGAGLAGFNPIHEGLHLLDRETAGGERTLAAFDKGRENLINTVGVGKSLRDDEMNNALKNREMDPNSNESRMAQAIATQLGVNPNVAKKMTAAQFKNYSPAFLKMYEQAQANNRTKMQTDQRANAPTRMGSQRLVPSSTATQIGEYDAALKMVDDLEKDYNRNASQLGSSVGRWVNGASANKYMDDAKLAAQNIGRVLEGGKLTDADYERYVDRLGLPSDTNAKAKNKFNQLRNQIKIKKDALIKSQGAAGYKSQDFSNTVRITNGKETYDIDPKDLPQAQSEGFYEVK